MASDSTSDLTPAPAVFARSRVPWPRSPESARRIPVPDTGPLLPRVYPDHLLLSGIAWDTDGMRAVEDCGLPQTVLAVNVPVPEMSPDELTEYLGELLTEVYGFRHHGFGLAPIALDGMRVVDVAAGVGRLVPFRSPVPWGLAVDAVLDGSVL